jgi:hypothetical protein
MLSIDNRRWGFVPTGLQAHPPLRDRRRCVAGGRLDCRSLCYPDRSRSEQNSCFGHASYSDNNSLSPTVAGLTKVNHARKPNHGSTLGASYVCGLGGGSSSFSGKHGACATITVFCKIRQESMVELRPDHTQGRNLLVRRFL